LRADPPHNNLYGLETRRMPDTPNPHDIFDNVGLVRGLSFTPATSRRFHSLIIKLGRGEKNQLLRTLSLSGRNFDEVFAEAIAAIADWRGITDAKLLRLMKDSRTRFMAYYGLVYETVSYTTVTHDPAKAEKAAKKPVKRVSKH
jgi:hypothetical protein